MALYTNQYDYPVELHVRIPNKEYYRAKVDNVDLDSPEFTTYPFKGIYVLPGDTVDTGEAEIYEEVNLMLWEQYPAPDGTTYKNESAEIKIVFYKINGKKYHQPSINGDTMFNSPTATSYIADSVYVPPGKTATIGNAVIDYVGVIGVDDPTYKYGSRVNGVLTPEAGSL